MEENQNIWDKLYEALQKVQQPQELRLVLRPYSAKLAMLPIKYEKLGYPLGKNNRGWKKWFKREVVKVKKEFGYE